MSARPYRIAIVGSYDPKRVDEIKLRNHELAPQAGEQLGQALAKKGFQIIVYGSYPYLLDVDVVRGYTSVVESEPDCIHVYFSQHVGQPKFGDLSSEDPRFRFQADRNENWEVSFYQSIADIDGMLLLGGGPSALIAGIVALSHKKPIVVCADFGGEARKVWNALSNKNALATDDEIARMGNAWTSTSADRMIAILENQIRRAEAEEAKTAAAEKDRADKLLKKQVDAQRRSDVHLAASIIALILALIVFSLTLAQPETGSRFWQVLIFLTAMLTGISGSTGTVLVEELTPSRKTKPRRITSTIGLGAIAGFATVGLFLLAQVFINPENTTPLEQPGLYQRLFMFTMVIGLIAGLTFESVFKRLREIDVVQTGGLQLTSTSAVGTPGSSVGEQD